MLQTLQQVAGYRWEGRKDQERNLELLLGDWPQHSTHISGVCSDNRLPVWPPGTQVQDVVVQRNKAPLLCFVDISSTKLKLLSFKLHNRKNSTTPPTSAAQKLDPQARTLSKVSLEWHDWQESMLLTEKRNNLGLYRWLLKALDQKGTCLLHTLGFSQ